MISLNNLSVHFGNFVLFDGISFMINPRDRIGLVGKNGAGKSTLLKVLLGMIQPDEGGLAVPSGISYGYLPQQMVHENNKTVFDEVLSAFEEVLSLEREMELLNEKLSSRTDYQSESYLELIHQLSEANERYQIIGGASIHSDLEKTLFGLGFTTKDFSRPTREFSGGWRMRIELAKLLLSKPDVLLLDEPTNHLDIESIQWLEEYLKDFPGAIVLISHDRAFLDAVTLRTIEISLGKIYDYKVPYSRYVVLRKERMEQQLAAFKNQQKMIEDTEQFIERFRYKATKAVQVQSRIKQLEKLERLEVDEEDASRINIRFAPAPRSGTIVIEATDLTKKFDENTILEKIELIVERGEKIAFVGKNGEGKTTLSRIIVGELNYHGRLKLGHNVRIGYFAQNQDELLNENKTVFQTIDDVATGEIRTQTRNILGAFLFGGDSIEKKVKVLSGGERSRLAIAKLLLEPYNLLVLDEPTNHLDMRSKDILKQALKKYDGSLVIVSHDREFLDGLVGKVYEFKGRKIRQHIGGIYDFLARKKMESLKELELHDKRKQQDKPEGVSESKLNYEGKKEFERNLRKAKNKVSHVEKEIAAIETELASLQEFMKDPEKSSDPDIYKRFSSLNQSLERKLYEWELLNDEMEAMQKEK
jgi:ATP-binding cassette, subfamily F, member 3